MMFRSLRRIARMGPPEILWRTQAAARIAFDRGRFAISQPRWDRRDLASIIAAPQLDDVRGALKDGRWLDAHAGLARHFRSSARFVIAPRHRPALVERIAREFPGSAAAAAARADRIVAGDYDLLGYQGLRFGTAASPDWQYDPVNDRRAPSGFWADVPYLDPASGDHKIIWELNRHQHWLTLGRAYWLTGDPRYRATFERELASWLEQNPPLAGVNWASMLELAFRSLSWLWAIQFFAGSQATDDDQNQPGSPWLVDLLLALDRQLTHVEQNLSYYFSPNTHLLGEALALYVVGRALPELAASARREQIGRDILVAEIERQICADGCHAERSTHYHRYTLDFYALALVVARNTGDDAAAVRFEAAVVRLAGAARLLSDDSGQMPHIGDDDGGVLLPLTGRGTDDLRDSLAIAAALVHRPDFQIGAAPEEALWMLGAQSAISRSAPAASPVTSAALSDTGYYVSRSHAGNHLVIDGGPHGYQNGGHAHADALSLTLAVGGVPLLIDPGTGSYTSDRIVRDRLRSTALHNTLALDDRPQSVPSGPFHWAHVANSRVRAWRTNHAFDYFDGVHDGYRPLEHRRRVLSLHGDLVVVADLVHGPSPSSAHAAAVHWHVDRRWNVELHSRGATLTRGATKNADGDRRVGLSVPQGLIEPFVADQETGLGWCSPEYGRLEPSTTVRISQSGPLPMWMVTVFDFDPDNPVAAVDWLPVWAEAGALAHATAIRITRRLSTDHVLFAAADADRRTDDPAEHHRLAPAPAIAPVRRASTWRIAEFETDARLLYCRSAPDGHVERLAMVDGSTVRAAGRRGFEVALPRATADFYQDSRMKDQAPCAGSPVS